MDALTRLPARLRDQLRVHLHLAGFYLGERLHLKTAGLVVLGAALLAASYFFGYATLYYRVHNAFAELAGVQSLDGVLLEESVPLKLAVVKVQVNLLHETEKQMRDTIYQQEHALTKLKEQLYFYRKIIAPEDLPSGLSVLSAQLDEPLEDGRFPLQLVLRKGDGSDAAVQGHVELAIVGEMDDAVRRLPMDDFYEGDTDFSFKYFQRLNGVVGLPNGFVPSRVEAKALAPKYDPAESSWEWSELLPGATGPGWK